MGHVVRCSNSVELVYRQWGTPNSAESIPGDDTHTDCEGAHGGPVL